jgi:hypothetical protein
MLVAVVLAAAVEVVEVVFVAVIVAAAAIEVVAIVALVVVDQLEVLPRHLQRWKSGQTRKSPQNGQTPGPELGPGSP